MRVCDFCGMLFLFFLIVDHSITISLVVVFVPIVSIVIVVIIGFLLMLFLS